MTIVSTIYGTNKVFTYTFAVWNTVDEDISMAKLKIDFLPNNY